MLLMVVEVDSQRFEILLAGLFQVRLKGRGLHSPYIGRESGEIAFLRREKSSSAESQAKSSQQGMRQHAGIQPLPLGRL